MLRLRFICFLLWFALGSASAVAAQVTLGDDLSMNLDGSVSFGYAGTNNNLVESAHGLAVGGQAELRGSYFDPRFLNFIVSPYYNESRQNSGVSSVFDTSGLNAMAQFFGGSHYPGSISFGTDWNHEGQFGIPGTTAYKTRGNDHYFNVNWGLYLPDLPGVSVSYGTGASAYEVLGAPTKGSSDSQSFNVRSTYVWDGFNLNGGYSRFDLNQSLPEITEASSFLSGNTNQDQIQFGVSRRFGQDIGFATNASRSHYTLDFSGAPTNQTFDSLAATLNIRPQAKLRTVVGFSYTDNLAASLFQPVPEEGGTPQYISLSESSHALDLGVSATYLITTAFNAQASYDHRAQTFEGIAATTDAYSVGVDYSRTLLGGSLGAYAGVTHFAGNLSNQGATGGSGNLSYTRRFGAWAANGSFRYARNAQTAINTLTQSGYGYAVNASSRVKSWYLTLNANGNENRIDAVANSSSFSHAYSSSLSNRTLSFNGSFNRSTGNSIQSGAGLIATPVPTPVVPQTLLVLFGGSSYAGAVGYAPVRGLTITCDYSRASYRTQNLSQVSRNSLSQFDAKSEWYYRQIHFTGGYTRLLQGFGAFSSTSFRVNSFYAGIYRSIRFF